LGSFWDGINAAAARIITLTLPLTPGTRLGPYVITAASGDVIDTTEALRLIPVERLESVRDHFAAALVAR